jgi:hypothetical protein
LGTLRSLPRYFGGHRAPPFSVCVLLVELKAAAVDFAAAFFFRSQANI